MDIVSTKFVIDIVECLEEETQADVFYEIGDPTLNIILNTWTVKSPNCGSYSYAWSADTSAINFDPVNFLFQVQSNDATLNNVVDNVVLIGTLPNGL